MADFSANDSAPQLEGGHHAYTRSRDGLQGSSSVLEPLTRGTRDRVGSQGPVS